MVERMTREERQRRKQELVEKDNSTKYAENHAFDQTGERALNFAGYNVKFFKPELGQYNVIDILPFIIQTENHPLVRVGKRIIGDEDYFLDFHVHYKIGPGGSHTVICNKATFGESCYVCDQADRIRHERGLTFKDMYDDQNLKNHLPSARVLYCVRVVGTEELLLFEVAYNLFHKEMKETVLRDIGGSFDVSDLQTGKSVKVYAKKKSFPGGQFTAYKSFSFIDRKPLPESIYEQTWSLDQFLNIKTYDEVKALYEGSTGPGEAKKENTVTQEPAVVSRPLENTRQKDDSTDVQATARVNGVCHYGHVFGQDHRKYKECHGACSDSDFEACKGG